MGGIQKMKAIIVDNSERRRRSLAVYLKNTLKAEDIIEVSCLNGALLLLGVEHRVEIKDNPEDWIVTVNTKLPRFIGGDEEVNGGLEVLQEMARIGFKCPVLLVPSGNIDIDKWKEAYRNLRVTTSGAVSMA